MTDMSQDDQPTAINPIDEDVPWDEAYEVVVHNDSETTLEFVVELLMSHFLILQNEAVTFALRVHANGHTAIGRLTEQAARNVRDSMLSRSGRQGAPLKVEVSKWAAARATTE